VNFGPVNPEFKIGKYVHPVVSFFKINLAQDPPNFHHVGPPPQPVVQENDGELADMLVGFCIGRISFLPIRVKALKGI